MRAIASDDELFLALISLCIVWLFSVQLVPNISIFFLNLPARWFEVAFATSLSALEEIIHIIQVIYIFITLCMLSTFCKICSFCFTTFTFSKYYFRNYISVNSGPIYVLGTNIFF